MADFQTHFPFRNPLHIHDQDQDRTSRRLSRSQAVSSATMPTKKRASWGNISLFPAATTVRPLSDSYRSVGGEASKRLLADHAEVCSVGPKWHLSDSKRGIKALVEHRHRTRWPKWIPAKLVSDLFRPCRSTATCASARTKEDDRRCPGFPKDDVPKPTRDAMCYLELLGPYPSQEELDHGSFAAAWDQQLQSLETGSDVDGALYQATALDFPAPPCGDGAMPRTRHARNMPTRRRIILGESAQGRRGMDAHDGQDDGVFHLVNEYARQAEQRPRSRVLIRSDDDGKDGCEDGSHDRRIGQFTPAWVGHNPPRRGSAPETAPSKTRTHNSVRRAREAHHPRLARCSSLQPRVGPGVQDMESAMATPRRGPPALPRSAIPIPTRREHPQSPRSATSPVNAQQTPLRIFYTEDPALHARRPQDSSHAGLIVLPSPPQPGPPPNRPLPAPPMSSKKNRAAARRQRQKFKRGVTGQQVLGGAPTPKLKLPSRQSNEASTAMTSPITPTTIITPLTTPSPRPDAASSMTRPSRATNTSLQARRKWVHQKKMRDLQAQKGTGPSADEPAQEAVAETTGVGGAGHVWTPATSSEIPDVEDVGDALESFDAAVQTFADAIESVWGSKTRKSSTGDTNEGSTRNRASPGQRLTQIVPSAAKENIPPGQYKRQPQSDRSFSSESVIRRKQVPARSDDSPKELDELSSPSPLIRTRPRPPIPWLSTRSGPPSGLAQTPTPAAKNKVSPPVSKWQPQSARSCSFESAIKRKQVPGRFDDSPKERDDLSSPSSSLRSRQYRHQLQAWLSSRSDPSSVLTASASAGPRDAGLEERDRALQLTMSRLINRSISLATPTGLTAPPPTPTTPAAIPAAAPAAVVASGQEDGGPPQARRPGGRLQGWGFGRRPSRMQVAIPEEITISETGSPLRRMPVSTSALYERMEALVRQHYLEDEQAVRGGQ